MSERREAIKQENKKAFVPFIIVVIIAAIIVYAVNDGDTGNYFKPLFGVMSFVISMILIVVIQQKIIDLEKQINPEKNGSVYDMKFAKKWEESSDEAQRLNIYKASYISHQVTSKVMVFVWLVLVLGSFFHDTPIINKISKNCLVKANIQR